MPNRIYRLLFLLAFFATGARQAEARLIYEPSWEKLKAGTPLTNTAGGAWSIVVQHKDAFPEAVLAGGSPAALLLSNSHGWCAVGNGAQRLGDGSFEATVEEGDQAWIFSRWNGEWRAFYPDRAYYLRLVGGGARWTAGKFSEGLPTDLASGSFSASLKGPQRLRLVHEGGLHRAELNGVELGRFSDPAYASGGIGLMVSPNYKVRFSRLSVDDGVPTATPTITLSQTRTPVHSLTRTWSTTPTHTFSPTLTASPTATFTPEPTLAWKDKAYPVTFKPDMEPVLVPDGDPDGEVHWLQEPSVIVGPDGLLHMFYSGGVPKEAVFLATSSDGVHWKKHSNRPIMGQGYGGYEGTAARARQIKIGDTYHIYFYGSGAIHTASSKDGYNYTYNGSVMDGEVFKRAGMCPYGFTLDSMAPIADGKGFLGLACLPKWGACLPWGRRGWIEWLFKSDDGRHWEMAAKEPMHSVVTSNGNDDELYCLRQMLRINGRWHAWPFIGYPTNIWHSVSDDGQNWQTDPFPVIQYRQQPYGLPAVNQVADPDVIEFKGQLFMYYSVNDNMHNMGVIALARWPGTFEQYAVAQEKLSRQWRKDHNILLPTPTPRPKPTAGR